MKKIIILLAVLAAMAVLSLTLSARPASDPAGTWIGKTEVPNQGTDSLTLVLEKTAKGWAGTVVDTLQLIAPQTVLVDIKVEGGEITFHFPLVDSSMIECKLKMDGEKMTGQWATAEGETGELTFEKKK